MVASLSGITTVLYLDMFGTVVYGVTTVWTVYRHVMTVVTTVLWEQLLDEAIIFKCWTVALLFVIQGYEPYMIAARKNVPWYDERFRGQGRDRIVQTLSMAGFVSFTVHPTVYLTQQPHPVTPSTQLAKASITYRQVCMTHFLCFMLYLLQWALLVIFSTRQTRRYLCNMCT